MNDGLWIGIPRSVQVDFAPLSPPQRADGDGEDAFPEA